MSGGLTRITAWLTAILVLCSSASHAESVGFRGPSYAGAGTVPTGSKAQSKLWWNDGSWWGYLWSARARSFTIHRLDGVSQTWRDTGTAVDPRPRSHGDCLWDGAKLYVASNQYTAGTGDPGDALDLYRFSYNPNTDVYSLDSGFPALIGNSSTEVLTLDKDSRGKLWAAWTSGRRVWTAHSQRDDLHWSVPAVHPRMTADISGDDIGALFAFQGDKIGVLWSDQVTDTFRFSFHRDADPDTTWSPVETALSGSGAADDQISVRASGDGRVFAALKSTTNHVLLATRSAAGVWSFNLITSAVNEWTRPIVVLDEQHRVVHVFATSPAIEGTIYEKTSPMDGLGFAAGRGTPVVRDAAGPAYNDATSTKQSVSGATGLVVLASQLERREYGHHRDSLGGSSSSAPAAAFSASEREGSLPMRVQFLDSSRGQPTSWSWAFGDGGTSTAQHPVHSYAQAGTYSVSLQVANGLGSSALTLTGLVHVGPQPTSVLLRPIADTQVSESQSTSNYADLTTMRVRADGTADYHAYVEFFVPPDRNRITSALLRLHCTDGSTDGGSLFRIGRRWSEPSFTWDTAPELGGAPVAQLGDVATDEIVVADLSSLVTTSGTLSLGLLNGSSNSVFYSTREGIDPPTLELTLQPWPGGPPISGFEENRTRGGGPMTVQFFDTSSGPVTSWSWNFGDGSTSNLENPSHVFDSQGSFDVSLTVTGPNGSNTLVKPDLVVVNALPSVDDRHEDAGTHELGPPPFLPMTSAWLEDPVRYGRSLLRSIAAQHVKRRGCEHTFVFELAGSFEQTLDSFEDCLLEVGFEISKRSLSDSAAGARSITLELRGVACAGRLVLQQRSSEIVLATLSLSFE